MVLDPPGNLCDRRVLHCTCGGDVGESRVPPGGEAETWREVAGVWCRKVGWPAPVTRQRPKSGSRKDWPMRSDPSRVGEGREEVRSGGGNGNGGVLKGEEGVWEKIELVSYTGGKSRRDENFV